MPPKKMRERKRQSKLNFSPTAKPSSTTTSRVAPSENAKATSRKAQRKMMYSSSEDELAADTERGLQLGMPVTSTQQGMFDRSDIDTETSEEEDGTKEEQVKAKIDSRKRRHKSGSSDSESHRKKTIAATSKQKRRHNAESEESEGDDLRLPRSKRRKTVKRQITPDDGGEEEDEVIPLRSRPRVSSRRQQSSDIDEQYSTPRSKRRNLARKRAASTDDEEEEEEKGPEQGNRGDIYDDIDEQEDLQEDLAFLKSSPLPNRGKLRSAHEKPKNERQKALEALKKRRAGTNEPSSSTTPSRTRGRRIIIESQSESDSELEIIKEEPESELEMSTGEEDEEEEPDRDANALDMFLEDNDDAGFIDDDVDAIIGEPILGPDDLMPLIVSRLMSAKPRELFKYAIEWMVMKKIHPAFDSKSQVYDLTFRKLDDEVKGLANSKFSSSAWTSDFSRALRARPDLMSMDIGRGKRDIMTAHCEACNRKNHPASSELTFTGKPYNEETLEPLENNSDSDSNNDSDTSDDSEISADTEADLNGERPAYDSRGVRLPPESKSFTLGATCKANAQVAHTLHHWRYHLYSWVKDYLAREGHLTAEKLVKRDQLSEKKREKAALKIVKAMEEDGEIKKLYKLYKEQVEYAVEARHDLQDAWRNRR